MRMWTLMTLTIVSSLLSGVCDGRSGGSQGISDSSAPVTTAEGTLKMEIAGGRPVVMVTLNGHGPYRFILDTGAMISVIDASLAHELELPIVGETELASPAGGTPGCRRNPAHD